MYVRFSIGFLIASAFGLHEPPWAKGIATILSSIGSSIAYSIIATFTIKKYENVKA